jgi:AmpE protein
VGMTFIITLISLVIERFFHWSQLRQWRWFVKYQHGLSRSRVGNWPFWLLLILCVLPLLLVVGLVNQILDHWLYGILKLIFGIVVLMYCLGPSNLWVQVFASIDES